MIGVRGLPLRRSVLGIVISRIIAIALVAVALEIADIANNYYLDEDALAKSFVEHEVATMATGVRAQADGLQFVLPMAADYYRGRQMAYAFRVFDADGRLIAAAQPSIIEQISPWSPRAPNWPDKWLRRWDDRWLHVSGGGRLRIAGHDVRIEIATLGDPAGAYWRALRQEFFEHVAMPMAPFLLMVVVVTIYTVRRTLLPVALAAEQADAIDPRNPEAVLNVDDMPKEIASFGAAVNRALERVRQLVDSQKMFLATVAHELRTPLAVALLELGKIDNERARRLEVDIQAMNRLVGQLLALVRLELVKQQDVASVDLETVARSTVTRLAPWIMDQGDNVEFEVDRPGAFAGDTSAIADALRNLVENAVKHSPSGTTIRVTVGPGSQVCVEDSGPGLGTSDVGSLTQPFQKGDRSRDGFGLGLAIVQKIAELHNGNLAAGRSALGGARFELCFSGMGGQFRSA